MSPLKLGVRLESLGLSLRQGLAEAARLGVTGVQVDAINDLSPRVLSESGRREFRTLLKTHNLELTALGCPLRRGLDAAEDQQPRIEHVRQVMTLAYELGPRKVIVQAGPVRDKPDTPEARAMRESLEALGRHGDKIGVTLALETGLESGEALASWLASFDTGSLGVNLDPANLLMHGHDPIAAVVAGHRYLVHAHAKDARRASANRTAQEVPLGHGDIDWLAFVEALAAVEYRGWLVVEREAGDNRLADVTAGLAFLRRLL